MSEGFSIPVRVYYEDTDAGGVVYYANYLKFMERALTEWLRSLGFEQHELLAREGVLFAVRSVRLEFEQPARFNDALEVTAQVVHRGGASLTFAQEVRRAQVTLCRGEVKIACLEAASFRPKPIPAQIILGIDNGRPT